VQRGETKIGNLFGAEKVTQIGSRVAFASITSARFVDGAAVDGVVGFFDIDDLFAVGITMNETSYDAVSSDVFYTQNIQGLMVPHVSITDNFSG